MEANTELLSRLVVGRKSDGRSVYDPQAKRELVESCLKPGTSVARTALCYGINANMLHAWIAQYQGRRVSRAKERAPSFVPVQINAAEAVASKTAAKTVCAGVRGSGVGASVRHHLQARLPNGIVLELSEVDEGALRGLIGFLSELACSASTPR